MNVDAIKEYAKKLLKLSVELNEFDKYVIAFSRWRIPLKNPEGIEQECVFAKMEAIYDYYRENPSYEIDKKFYSYLDKYTEIIKGSYNFLAILRMIEYQIVSEKENRAPFKIDNATLLNKLKNNLYQNQQLYKNALYEEENFWGTIERYDETLSNNYGYKIL